MKKTIPFLILLYVLYSVTVEAQISTISSSEKSYNTPYLQVQTTDIEQIMFIGNEIISRAKRKYNFDGANQIGYQLELKYTEAEPKSGAKPLVITVQFFAYMKDKNEALEIEGTPEFLLREIRGSFLDLFPFWKTYFDPEADLEKMAIRNGIYEKEISDRKYSFKQDTTYDTKQWIIITFF